VVDIDREKLVEPMEAYFDPDETSMSINSTTKVNGFNADRLDGQDASQFVPTGTNSFVRNATYRTESNLGPGELLGDGTY